MKLLDLIPGVSQAKLILAGVALALFAVPTVALFITRHTLASVKSDRDVFHAQRDAEIAKNTVNLSSIAKLGEMIAAKNAESDARAKAFQDAKAADARTIADLDRRYAATGAAKARLETIARLPGSNPACRAPRAVTDSLEGV